MPFVIGAVLALAVGLMATTSGMDRDRAFYPVVTMVVASYYVLFAVLGGSTEALVLEAAIGMGFVVTAIAGYRRSLWIAVAALAGHGALDVVHGAVVDNPGVPAWWSAFCGAYDVAAALYLGWLLRSGRARAVMRSTAAPA